MSRRLHHCSAGILTLSFVLMAAVSSPSENNRSNSLLASDTTWHAVIAGPDEPGIRLTVSGIVYAKDGTIPVPGVHIHVYHTDAEGNYAPPGSPQGTHRLKADMITNREGRYRFATIKPASYPNSTVPSHIHYRVQDPQSGEEHWYNLEFEGDSHLSAKKIAREKARGKFTSIVATTPGNADTLVAEFNLRLK